MKRFWGFGILAVILALAACAAGEKGDPGEDAVLDDDTEGDDADDDTGGDDTDAPSCAEVWMECEYENPVDQHPEIECGVMPTDFGEEWKTWHVCTETILRDGNQVLADCGMANECTDWKFDFYTCEAGYHAALIVCATEAVDGGTYALCQADAQQAWICGDF